MQDSPQIHLNRYIDKLSDQGNLLPLYDALHAWTDLISDKYQKPGGGVTRLESTTTLLRGFDDPEGIAQKHFEGTDPYNETEAGLRLRIADILWDSRGETMSKGKGSVPIGEWVIKGIRAVLQTLRPSMKATLRAKCLNKQQLLIRKCGETQPSLF